MTTRLLSSFALLTALLGGCGGKAADGPTLTPQPATLVGVYAGRFPCSNCAAIEATLWLRPDGRFFPELARTLAEVHARGMAHNDLSKPENVLVRADGRPVLIDFQIAFAPRSARWPVVGVLARAALRFLQRVDRYHLKKLHRRARPLDFTHAQRAEARRKGPVVWLHGLLLRRPYRAVRHAVLDRWMRVEENRRAA